MVKNTAKSGNTVRTSSGVSGDRYQLTHAMPGNFSFIRIYESGHEVPFYQPKASLEFFRRVLGNLIVSDGSEAVTPSYSSPGLPNATHTEPFVPLPPPTSTSSVAA